MNTLPLVLCGPIVRRVDDRTAAIFVCTREPASVTLSVHRDEAGQPGETLMTGTRATVPIGPMVHLAVVVARTKRPVPWGTRCLYDLRFGDGEDARNLADFGVLTTERFPLELQRLVYPGRALPGFVIPPAEPRQIHLLHGSCRKPHGPGPDALEIADARLEAAYAGRAKLPQQLILTGDQIYADDVHPGLLKALIAVEAAWLGAGERNEIGTDLPDVGERQTFVEDEAGFSSKHAANHLVTFGEFVAMYLMAWSPVPWSLAPAALAKDKKLAGFVQALPRVRRALANIATYMIFDDHEVTDDWNIRQAWSDRVAGRPHGPRIVRNAMTAYGLFQHWGNTPDAFAADAPGASLLERVQNTAGVSLPISLDPVVGGLAGAPGSLRWGWRWSNPACDVIALDSRTRRGPAAEGERTLMTRADIDDALGLHGDAPPFTVVVSAAPVLGVELIEWAQEQIGKFGSGAETADVEAWGRSTTVGHLVTRMLERSPTVVLSGDVHYGFVATGVGRSGMLEGARLINCVGSALRNQSGALMYFGFLLGGVVPHAHAPAGAPTTQVRAWEVEEGVVIDEEVPFFDYDLSTLEVPIEGPLVVPHADIDTRRSPVLPDSNLAEIDLSTPGKLRQTLWHGVEPTRPLRVEEATFHPRGEWLGPVRPAVGPTPAVFEVVSWGPRRLDLFARRADDRLSTCYFADGAWGRWGALAGPTLTSAPSAVSWGDGRLDVFARAADGRLVQWWWDRTRDGRWRTHALAAIEGRPRAVSRGRRSLDVVARGPGGGLLRVGFGADAWRVESLPDSAGCAHPVAVARGAQRLEVFAIDADGHLRRWSWSGSAPDDLDSTKGEWITESVAGRSLTPPLTAVRRGDDAPAIDLLARDAGGDLCHIEWGGTSSRSAWVTVDGGRATVDAVAVSPAPDRLDVFARRETDGVLVYDQRVGDTWVGWRALGRTTAVAARPAAIAWADRRIDVFAVTADDRLAQWYQKDWSVSD